MTKGQKPRIESGLKIIRLLEKRTKDRRPAFHEVLSRATAAALLEAWELANSKTTRELLCDIYGYRKMRSAVPILIEALHDRSAGVRASAADALGKIRHASAGPRLFEALLQEPDAGVRVWLTSAVGACGYQEAAGQLLELLDDENPIIRGSAVWALGELRREDAISKLRALRFDISDPSEKDLLDEALTKIIDEPKKGL